MTNEQYQTILRGIESLGALLKDQIADVSDEIRSLRGDVQQEKTASRAAKKRDWRILKMLKLKGGR